MKENTVKNSVFDSEFFEFELCKYEFYTLFLAECDFHNKMKFPSEDIAEQYITDDLYFEVIFLSLIEEGNVVY